MEASLIFHEGKEKSRLWHFLHRHSFSSCGGVDQLSADRALDIRGLTFSYGKQKILNHISLSVKPGEICGLLGPNGCGKSTLFRCCMGFLHPEQGQIHVRGVNIAHMKPSSLARHIAYVPQEHRLPFPFEVRDMVLMGRTPRMSGWFRLRKEDERIAEEAMARIGITHLADRPFSQLSGGQRQLALIARAMAQQTPLILLDEPTSALDFSNQLAVWSVLREVASQGVAVLVCCHDPNHILWFCDKAAVMHEGSVCAEGPASEIVTEDVLQRIYGPQCVRINAGTSGIVCPIQTRAQN
ncbi:MAG: ABC transporter ATP-binding protein [Mailhella sp.]|nr:ABC transporter ATP-binding protein [Mailhella sp.]